MLHEVSDATQRSSSSKNAGPSLRAKKVRRTFWSLGRTRNVFLTKMDARTGNEIQLQPV
jgi:hypothetical protein